MRLIVSLLTLALLAGLSVWLGRRGRMGHTGCTCRDRVPEHDDIS